MEIGAIGYSEKGEDMARLIDADKFLENNKELADCDFIHPKYCDTLRDLVNNAPTVCDIEQIRAEIADRLGLLDCKKDILAIIDKYTKGDKHE